MRTGAGGHNHGAPKVCPADCGGSTAMAGTVETYSCGTATCNPTPTEDLACTYDNTCTTTCCDNNADFATAVCTDTNTDINNCGGCGIVCPNPGAYAQNNACVNGACTCQPYCPKYSCVVAPYADGCGGTCPQEICTNNKFPCCAKTSSTYYGVCTSTIACNGVIIIPPGGGE